METTYAARQLTNDAEETRKTPDRCRNRSEVVRRKAAVNPEKKLKELDWARVTSIFKNMTGLNESDELFDSLYETKIQINIRKPLKKEDKTHEVVQRVLDRRTQ